MTLRQREPRQCDAAHLAFVRKSGCCVCPKGVNRPIEAAHIRFACPARGKLPTGMQEKPHDKWTVGLCDYHHRTGILAQHKMNEADFWAMHGRDPFAIAMKLWAESGGEARAREPRPAKRPRKISRKRRHEAMLEQGMHSGNTDAKFDPPPKPKRRIQGRATFPAGRKLQSRNNFERREAR